MPKRKRNSPDDEALVRLVLDTLDDMKAERVVTLDVRHLTTVTDHMIVASGPSPGG